MRKLIMAIASLLFISLADAQYLNVAVGTSTPASSAVFEARSTTQGLLPPRMRQSQRNGIVRPVAGLMVWCSNCGAAGELQVYNGTAWTNMVGGTAAGLVPEVTTTDITGLTRNSAMSGGNVTDSGDVAVTLRGVCWSTSANPTVSLTTKTENGSGIGSFASNISGLIAGTTYYLRAYATNSMGTSYGSEKIFTTSALTVPVLTTAAVSSIVTNKAVSGGNISSDGGSAIALRGVCWDSLPNPTVSNAKTSDGSGTGSFSSNISGLKEGKTYYVRAYAINGVGTAYGNELSFTTTITANLPSVTIGTQVWQSNNLDVATYRNGDPIPRVDDEGDWATLTTGAYCYYNNDSARYAATYGKLYNGFAVIDPRGLAPAGWHISTDAEWTTLENQLGGSYVAGGALKSTKGWNSPNKGATNSSGFSGLPGGYRYYDGGFNSYVGAYGYFWSSTELSTGNVWYRTLLYFASDLSRHDASKQYGFSVRCVRGDITMPELTTTNITGLTANSAMSGGNVTDSGGDAITLRGVCWSTSANPTVSLTTKTENGSGSGSFTSYVSSLSFNTTYYLRAYATNSMGTSYGSEKIFTTPAATLPVLTTAAVSSIFNNTAVSGGNISSDGGSAIALRGVCWDALPNPTVSSAKTSDGGGTGSFSSNINGLMIAGKTYYVRAYAINGVGTAYGNELSFTASSAASLPNVTIGTQIWQSKNLDVATYRNGNAIPKVTDATQWANLTTGAWCWYNNDSTTYAAIYGRLYNWYAVVDPRGLCPTGWHVPSRAEWTTLENQLGGSSVAGGALKSTTGWASPNTGSTNSTGFSGLPGGGRNDVGNFGALGSIGYFWSSTEDNTNTNNAWYRNMYYSTSGLGWDTYNKRYGFSVRCIRD